MSYSAARQRTATPQKARPQPNATSAKTPPNAADEAIRLNNLGTAYMGQQRFEPALKMFQQAAAADPKLTAAQLNSGIALLNLQSFDEARKILLSATERDPKDARAWYNLGLLYKGQGQVDESVQAFKHATELAPADADAFYFLGTVLSQQEHYKEAIAEFQRALKLNPFHASAEFGIARAYRGAGDAEQARQHLARFQQLTQSKLGVPISLAYGEQGPLSLVQQVRGSVPAVEAAIKITFVDASGKAGLPTAVPAPLSLGDAATQSLGPGACAFDFDGDGLPDIFLADAGPRGVALLRNKGAGQFDDATQSAGLESSQPALACAVSDYDNDGHPDIAVAFADRVRLFRNSGDGKFTDATESAALKKAASPSGLLWVDFDHDGDTDLLVLGRADAGNTLWRNNGNGQFTDWTEESGLAGKPPYTGASLTDANNDRAVDLLLTGARTELYLNPREGKWSGSQPIHSPGGAVAATVLDFDKDGWMDLAFTHNGAPGLSLWRNDAGKTFTAAKLPDLHWTRAWGVVGLDYDNDGWMDLAAVGETSDGKQQLRILRNEGPAGFRDVSADLGVDKILLKDPRALVAFDYDGDGDTDLLITQSAAAPVLLRNDGGNQNNSLRLALRGLNDNKSALGTKIEIFAGGLWQKIEVNGGGYLGQSATDLTIGLGKQKSADVVRMLWPTGVVQDETEMRADKRQSILEIDRRGSSCPVLFAWDGHRYRFVADMIGAGVVGHWIAPGERNVADSTEYVKLEDTTPAPRAGYLSFRLMEPMEEVVYLDQVRLLAIDHPAATHVYPNEYFASNPPFPGYKVIVSKDARPPAGAWDDAGRDVLPLLRARDRRYVDNLSVLPYRGFTRSHSLVLDLGAPYESGPLRLLLYGYIEYFTATGMYAAHQAGLDPVAPYVEAQDASGRWVRVVDDMGFPAGLPRTTVADLTGRLPRGTRRIRITTNLQIYWDQILIDQTAPEQSVRSHEVPLARAQLGFHGYPRAVEGSTPGDLRYVYEDVSRTGPYARQSGEYTRPGDVHALLKNSDDRFVIFGSGDEVRLDFDPASLPNLPAGWKRDYFFFADGFEKDMDFYAATGQTVAPLPFHRMRGYPYGKSEQYPDDPAHLDYRLDYNTRFYGDAPAQSYRFNYRPRVAH